MYTGITLDREAATVVKLESLKVNLSVFRFCGFFVYMSHIAGNFQYGWPN